MIYDYTLTTGKGEELKLSDYKGKLGNHRLRAWLCIDDDSGRDSGINP